VVSSRQQADHVSSIPPIRPLLTCYVLVYTYEITLKFLTFLKYVYAVAGREFQTHWLLSPAGGEREREIEPSRSRLLGWESLYQLVVCFVCTLAADRSKACYRPNKIEEYSGRTSPRTSQRRRRPALRARGERRQKERRNRAGFNLAWLV
jgi:hypothetical protein